MTTKTKPIVVVQGGQWGSEAKGNVAAALCCQRNIDFAVRTGSINAGHTVVYGGVRFAMQQIPTGWVNPRTQLVIGAGAYIHPPTLLREIEMVNGAMPGTDVRDRLWIDYRCGTHTEAAEELSAEANRHHSIGATGKGCSEAIVAKIRGRNAGFQLFPEWLRENKDDQPSRLRFADTVTMLNDAYDNGESILLEGTQGTHLDMHLGPYPYTTSRMTSAANWVAEAGLSPALNYEVVLVCRTYPIRVAGNSGPMNNEIEWTDLAAAINRKRLDAGMPQLVSLIAIEEFMSKMEYAAAEATTNYKYKVPTEGRRFKLRLSDWTPEERSIYRVAASELHRDALNLCSGSTAKELRRLFEMTTVTKKLRRLASINVGDLRTAITINRPSWIALTFLDYEVPEMMGATLDSIGDVKPDGLYRASRYIDRLRNDLGIPIRMVSTGPMMNNLFNAEVIDQKQVSGR